MNDESLFEQYFAVQHEFKDLDLTLNRIENAVRSVVPKLTNTKVVHIAGTNGKGSTSFFIAQLLELYGHSTILFTSPHTTTIHERIRYRLQNISHSMFDELFLRSKPLIEQYHLSYFETIYLMAIMLCVQEKPRYLILETGLGGRYDATNSDVYFAKIPVITSISQDHKNILGSKIVDILGEKLAIVRGNNPVFIGYNPDFIINLCREKLPDADLHLLPMSMLEQSMRLYSIPYCYNYMTAHDVVEYLLDMRISYEKLELPPCRQEIFGTIMLDGAHNAAGLLSLMKSWEEPPYIAIVSGTNDRDIGNYCSLLKSKVKNIVLTAIPNNPRSITFDDVSMLPYKWIEDPLSALDYAKKQSVDVDIDRHILITGSLYLCAYIRRSLVSDDV